MQKKRLFSRFMATLTDIVINLLPFLVWDLIIFVMLAGFISAGVLSYIDKVILYCVVVSFCVTAPFITLVIGKTLGQLVFDIRIKDNKGNPAKAWQRVLREFLAGIIFLGGFYVSKGIGVAAFLGLNFLVILIDKKARGILDFVCRTTVVYEPYGEENMIVVEDDKKKPTMVEKEIKPVVKEELNAPLLPSKDFYPYDLHVHSRHSLGGRDTVEEIFQKAKQLGIKVLSITDKYSIKANIEAEVLSKPYNIQYIPGIEMDCMYKGKKISVLGYNIDYKNPLFIQLENENVKQHRNASVVRIDKFKELTGIELNVAKLVNQTSIGVVTIEMIIKEVLQNTLYEDNELVKKYKDNPEGLYLDYFARGKSCHVQVELPDLEDVVQSIKASNGLIVLGSTKKYCGNDEEFIKEILSYGFDGIEVFSKDHNEEDVKQYLQIARDTNSFVSCGSNYYGKENVQIGDCKVNTKFEKVLMTLINRCLKKVEK